MGLWDPYGPWAYDFAARLYLAAYCTSRDDRPERRRAVFYFKLLHERIYAQAT